MFKKILTIVLSISVITLAFGTVFAGEQFPDLQSFYSATLTTFVSSSGTTVNVSTAPNVDTAFFVIEPRTSNQEIVRMTSRSGTALTVVRGLGTYGTSTMASSTNRAHASGVRIEIVDVHYYIKLIQASNVFTYRGATSTPSEFSAVPNAQNNDMIFASSTQRWYRFDGLTWKIQGDNTETIGGTKTFTLAPQVPYDQASTSAASVGYANTKVSLTGDETIAGTKTFTLAPQVPYSAASTSAASVGYANLISTAGAPNADETTKGIVELATTAEAAAGTSAGGTSARLALPASIANAASSATTIVPVTGSDGKLSANFFPSTYFNSSSTVQTFTASGTWTKPAGIKYVVVEIIGGGEGGGGCNAANTGCRGGDAGAYVRKLYPASALGATEGVVIGIAGNPGVGGVTNPVPGATSTFSTLIAGGGHNGTLGGGGYGSIASGGDLNIPGGMGNTGTGGSTALSGQGGDSWYGFGGPSVQGNTGGYPGFGYGAGGGGASGAGGQTGGVAKDGIAIISEFY